MFFDAMQDYQENNEFIVEAPNTIFESVYSAFYFLVINVAL